MISKSIKTLIVTSLIGFIMAFGYLIVSRIYSKERAISNLQYLPNLKLFTLDSLPYEYPVPSKFILFYFSSECDYCQYEVNEIKKSINSFNNVSIVLVSSEPIKIIEDFSFKYGLKGQPHVTFLKVMPEDVYDIFGSVSVPHIFIYGKDRKLIKEFKGETKMETILKYLP